MVLRPDNVKNKQICKIFHEVLWSPKNSRRNLCDLGNALGVDLPHKNPIFRHKNLFPKVQVFPGQKVFSVSKVVFSNANLFSLPRSIYCHKDFFVAVASFKSEGFVCHGKLFVAAKLQGNLTLPNP